MTWMRQIHEVGWKAPMRLLARVLPILFIAGLAGCTSAPSGETIYPVEKGQVRPVGILDAQIRNQANQVAAPFPSQPTVLKDEDGIESSRMFFSDSTSVIIADSSLAAQIRGASLAVFTHSPMLIYTEDNRTEVTREIERLGATRVLHIGDVGFATSTGTTTVMQDPATFAALGHLTAHQFKIRMTIPDRIAYEIADLDGREPVVLVAEGETSISKKGEGRVPALPIQPRRDGQTAPVTIATPDSPIASIANARAFGEQVRIVDEPDPRNSHTTLAATTGLSDDSLIALGSQFGNGTQLSRKIMQAEAEIHPQTRDY